MYGVSGLRNSQCSSSHTRRHRRRTVPSQTRSDRIELYVEISQSGPPLPSAFNHQSLLSRLQGSDFETPNLRPAVFGNTTDSLSYGIHCLHQTTLAHDRCRTDPLIRLPIPSLSQIDLKVNKSGKQGMTQNQEAKLRPRSVFVAEECKKGQNGFIT